MVNYIKNKIPYLFKNLNTSLSQTTVELRSFKSHGTTQNIQTIKKFKLIKIGQYFQNFTPFFT